MAEFLYGFAALAEMIPDIVGQPLEDEHYSGEGNSLQATTGGLLVWRKADNWTAFTDGERTWINGPEGLQIRLNTERFEWEADYAAFHPTIRFINAPSPSETYPFLRCPDGFCLHGTRSGVRGRSLIEEFEGTVGYALAGAGGLAWNYTVGPLTVAQHVYPKRWGWHARRASGHWIGIEIAQPTIDDLVTGEEARAVAECVRLAREVWPGVPLVFKAHSELEHEGLTGKYEGKSDCYPWYAVDLLEDLRGRIFAYL